LYSKFTGRNRSNLSLTYKEGRVAGVRDGRLTLAIWELMAFGFIKTVRWGRLERNCSIYGLDDRWRSVNGHWKDGVHGPENPPAEWAAIKAGLREIQELQDRTGVPMKRNQLFLLRRKLLPGYMDHGMAKNIKRNPNLGVEDARY
jgi:hypothetical protein